MRKRLTFKHILTPDGMLHDRTLVVDAQGLITAVEPAQGTFDGFLALPGMPNAHSHAFQRAMSGYGEAAAGRDSFWSWREAMYRLANAVTPDDMYAIARQAYADMLRAGFTSVAEFHYIHHGHDGAAGAEMAQAVIAAARATGIRLRLLPVFYHAGGFGKPALPAQHRFVHQSVGDYCRLLEKLEGVALGIAPHSLRAVPPQLLPELVQAAGTLLGGAFPIHIHIAEQSDEVGDCLTAYGKRPVELLADIVVLDDNWNLVHATHATAHEISLITTGGANVVICPITEAYLGDGLMEAHELVRQGGRLAIGSDSNCRIDALEELRWLEFGQRLRTRRRSLLADRHGLGVPLWNLAAASGALALQYPVGGIQPGRYADLVVFDESAAPFAGHTARTLLDALIINGGTADVAAVYVGGKPLVREGRHQAADDIRRAFDSVVRKIYAGA